MPESIVLISLLGNIASCFYYWKARKRYSLEVVRFALAQENRGLAAKRLAIADRKHLRWVAALVFFYLLNTMLAAFLPLPSHFKLLGLLSAGALFVGTVTFCALQNRQDMANEWNIEEEKLRRAAEFR
ncbi:MAG: hypothetical protein SFV17_12740 [Candidatus Obscuribacter sp.]|nr:hypothetical protein [Candidatus Melainabacteria bacterium]MDX1987547.1 hypothetical protein [Candidatus Obscuribacter sp.]